MGTNKDYSDLDRAPRKVRTERTPVAQRPVTGLSIFALLFGILAIPGSLMPFYGIIAAMIGIIVGIIALLRASRGNSPRAYAIGGLVLSIFAMGVAIFFTSAAMKATEGCETLRGDELRACVEEKKADN